MARTTEVPTDDAADEQPIEYNVTLLYLTYDEDNPRIETATDIRCFGLENPNGDQLLDIDTLATAYDERHSTTVEATDAQAVLSAVWRQWNRGSGHESEDFAQAKTRSLSAGDIVIVDTQAYFCAKIGWMEVNVPVTEVED